MLGQSFVSRLTNRRAGVSDAKLHKWLHTLHRLGSVQVNPKLKALIYGAFAEPSDGLEPSTPSL